MGIGREKGMREGRRKEAGVGSEKGIGVGRGKGEVGKKEGVAKRMTKKRRD